MTIRPKTAWFAAFVAAFAALAAFVFWGTWSLDMVPIMPDAPNVFDEPHYALGWVRGWFANGKFVPDDIKVFLGSPYLWVELQYALAVFCAGLGVAYYARGRGLSRFAAYGAGLLLAFCGYWFSLFSAGHLGWFRWMTYGVFAFGLADRAVRRGKWRHWLLLGACVAWGSFYQPDLWFLFTLLTAVYFVWCCVRERKLPWKGALIALAAFLAIAAPSLLGAETDRKNRNQQIADAKGSALAGDKSSDDRESRWIFVTNWSLPTAETAEFLVPRLNGDTSCPLTLSIGSRAGSGVRPYVGALGRPKDAKEGNYRQHSLYVGWVTCLLALCGVVFGWRRRDVRFFAVAALLCWLLSLGRNFEPLYRLVFALPIGDSIRAPVKWHHLTELCLAFLAAYGIDSLAGLRQFGRYGKWAISLLVLVGAFDLARVNRLYVAPFSVREVRRQNASMQMTVLRRQDFSNPQVAEMRRRGLIVSVANYLGNPDCYLVEVLTPRKPYERKPLPPMTTAAWFGLLSAVGTFAVLGFAVVSMRKERA